MKEMQKQYDVTWDYCRTSMIPIGKKYRIDAVFALTKAEDVFRGIENVFIRMEKQFILKSVEIFLVFVLNKSIVES